MSIIENPNEALVSQSQTILMVDDTSANLAVVGDYLTQQGYQVMVALSGETGLSLAQKAHPDLILLDVLLPGIDGFETCRRLKADEQTRDIPVIFMTIVTRTEDKVRGFEAGGVDYITKPFQHEEVLARVTTHLRIRELTQKLEEANASLELRVEERTSALAEANIRLKEEIAVRKKSEEEREQLLYQIRQQAKEVQFIIDTVPEGMFLLSENGHIRLANAIAEQYLTLLAPGWETAPLTRLGQSPLVDLMTSPPKGLWHDVGMGERLFEVIARPVENGPTNEGWVFVIRDVTREREIQQHLQAHERLAAVGQLAAGIAHDFNNTLAVIRLYTELLLRTLELPPRAEERLHILEQQTQRASDLIQQILDFSHQSVMERQPLNLLPFLKELIRLLRRTLPESIDIELDYAQGAYVIHADPSRIQQAVMNLAVNARDAMGEGGRLLIGLNSVRLEPGDLPPVPGMGPGEWILVSIADSGTGIPAEVVVHIFEPFFTTKERGQGTGLGLAQVYGIVQQHDGFIGVTTELGRGTTFQLYFPAFAVDCPEAAKPSAASLPQGQRQVVLVVEDEDAMRQALVESLTLLNYSVREARNGREALGILAQNNHEIALVLSDAVMPEMGGVALFHALRERGLTIPFVIVTGNAVEKDMENLRALGLYGWLKKPLELSKLAELLRQGLW